MNNQNSFAVSNKKLAEKIVDLTRAGKSLREACKELESETKQNWRMNWLRWKLFVPQSYKQEYEQSIHQRHAHLQSSPPRQHEQQEAFQQQDNAEQKFEEHDQQRQEATGQDERGQAEATSVGTAATAMNITAGTRTGAETAKSEHKEREMMEKDKIDLDLQFAVDQIVKDRQLLKKHTEDLDERLSNANDFIDRLTQDKEQLQLLVDEKNDSIDSFSKKLTSKEHKYDELLDAYSAFQTSSNEEKEELRHEIEKIQQKYERLLQAFKLERAGNMEKSEQYEEKIRELEGQNDKLLSQYNDIKEERANLLHTVENFTKNMRLSFSGMDPNASLGASASPAGSTDVEIAEAAVTSETDTTLQVSLAETAADASSLAQESADSVDAENIENIGNVENADNADNVEKSEDAHSEDSEHDFVEELQKKE